jgi:hypothetical protein
VEHDNIHKKIDEAKKAK